MSKTQHTLETTERVAGGKLTDARKKGMLPAVCYGNKTQALPFFLDRIEFQKVYKSAGGSSIVTITVNGKKIQTLVQEVSTDPITGLPTHVDFMVVDTAHAMHVSVPLEFIGEAPGAKTHNASVGKVLHEIEVEAMADKLPHSIEVDISSLVDLDSQITIADLKMPTGVTVHNHKDTDIVANLSVQKEEVETETELPAEVAAESTKEE